MTVDVCFQDAKSLYGSTTVPEKMIGCWERLYISFSDGTEDKTTRVIWLRLFLGWAISVLPPRGQTCADERVLEIAQKTSC